MIYPPIKNLTEKTDSKYSLVIATAKRARQISEDDTRAVTKPVVEAIREINNGDVVIVSSENKQNTVFEYKENSYMIEE